MTRRLPEAAWMLIFLTAAAVLRLYQLGDRPYHHDEAIHAYLSLLLWEGHPYGFDPAFHGPFLYWGNALTYSLLGADDFTARLLPALFSTGLVLPLWLLRQQLGRIGWKIAAVFLVLSPTFAYYGRFLAHDNYCVLFTLLLVWLGLGYRREPANWRMAAIGLVTGLFLATKAVVYVHLGLFAIFALLVLLLDTFAPRWPRRQLLHEGFGMLRVGWSHFVFGILVMLAVYLTLYSRFFTDWRNVWEGIYGTLAYWGGQQAAPRIPGPAYYFVPRLLLHEPVFWVALPALLWAGRQRERPFDLFLAYWTVAAFIVYGYAQEKVPWLLMHLLTPMVLLTGRWIDHLWYRRRLRLTAGLGLLVLFSWSLRESIWISFRMPYTDPHLLTYMASADAVPRVAERIRSRDPEPGQVFVAGPATWPLTWYLRDTEVSYGLPQGWEKTAWLVEAPKDDAAKLEAESFGHRDYQLMTWWYPDLVRLFTSDLLPYVLHHEIAMESGEYRFHIFERAPGAGQQSHDDE